MPDIYVPGIVQCSGYYPPANTVQMHSTPACNCQNSLGNSLQISNASHMTAPPPPLRYGYYSYTYVGGVTINYGSDVSALRQMMNEVRADAEAVGPQPRTTDRVNSGRVELARQTETGRAQGQRPTTGYVARGRPTASASASASASTSASSSHSMASLDRFRPSAPPPSTGYDSDSDSDASVQSWGSWKSWESNSSFLYTQWKNPGAGAQGSSSDA